MASRQNIATLPWLGFSPAALCRSAQNHASGSDENRQELACCWQDFIGCGTIYAPLTFFCRHPFLMESITWPIRRTNRATDLSSASLSSSSLLWAGTGTAAKMPRLKPSSKLPRQPHLLHQRRLRKLRHLPARPQPSPQRPSLLQPSLPRPSLRPLSLQRPSPLRLLARPLRQATDLCAPRFCKRGDKIRGQSLPPAQLPPLTPNSFRHGQGRAWPMTAFGLTALHGPRPSVFCLQSSQVSVISARIIRPDFADASAVHSRLGQLGFGRPRVGCAAFGQGVRAADDEAFPRLWRDMVSRYFAGPHPVAQPTYVQPAYIQPAAEGVTPC